MGKRAQVCRIVRTREHTHTHKHTQDLVYVKTGSKEFTWSDFCSSLKATRMTEINRFSTTNVIKTMQDPMRREPRMGL